MENIVNINQTFEKVISISKNINYKEFEDCTFKNCDFSTTDFSNSTFMDCEFIDCNLSMILVSNTSLKSVHFKNCKLLGVPFNSCADFLFSVSFQECILDYSIFANKKMPKTKFVTSSLKEANFIGANLSNSSFENCNLDQTIFNDTNLTSVDFTSAYNYKIDPEYNLITKAKFSIQGISGLLDKYDLLIE